MNGPVATDRRERETDSWASDMPDVRHGVFQSGERSVEYIVLQPAPAQWVVMALIPCESGPPRVLMVMDGRSEAEAFRRLARRLEQSGPPAALSSFVTDWAMRAPER